ncbi:energy transducer TonB [Helicobacter sp. Faydin-H64]|uniref:Energy transducer TonB n=1 Tax=Helicobacter turcicus TaxID=2867412 RepID=A0ABS7JMP1_9HELI|nr:energy transducer TonB [Helicobacter turcicus]MBX7545429.1 energy transducer TonB [Helicobacter turcicus]
MLFLLLFLRFEAKLENIYNPPQMGSEQGERVSLKHFKFQQGEASQNMESKTKDSKSVESLASLESKKQAMQQEIKKEIPQKQELKPQEKPRIAQKKESKMEADSKLKEIKTAKATQAKPSQASKTSNLSALEKNLSSPSIYDFGISEQTEQIKDLYGAEFGSLSPNAQKFIKSNLDKIGKITQRYLKYPAIAGKIGQEGDNIVEFYLYPNGDITDLKLLHSSSYTLLDDNSLHTIRIAYKDYPYPSEKTKIRIRVMYRIY